MSKLKISEKTKELFKRFKLNAIRIATIHENIFNDVQQYDHTRLKEMEYKSLLIEYKKKQDELNYVNSFTEHYDALLKELEAINLRIKYVRKELITK